MGKRVVLALRISTNKDKKAKNCYNARVFSSFNEPVDEISFIKVLKEVPSLVKKLYVGNLPYSYRDADLEALFADYGPVTSAVIIMDRNTNRSKGFGFVELEDDSMAASAIEALNGNDVDGRAIVVNEARPRE